MTLWHRKSALDRLHFEKVLKPLSYEVDGPLLADTHWGEDRETITRNLLQYKNAPQGHSFIGWRQNEREMSNVSIHRGIQLINYSTL